jgi:hypothetical protein
MRKKLILLLLLVVVLLGSSSTYVVEGIEAYGRFQRSHLALQRYCSDQVPVHICVRAPSAIFSAFYPFYVAAQYPLFIIEYSSSTPMMLVFNISINNGFSQLFSHNEPATATTQSISIVPPMSPHALDNLTDEEHTALHVVVTDLNNKKYYYNDIALTLHSRWLMQWTKENLPQIAAWVTPADKAVARLVETAPPYLKDQKSPPSSLIGYQQATRQQVVAQVNAIYDALRQYSIKYIQETVPYDGTDSGATEKILLPAEVLRQHRGMCIELTTLLASAVESIGLEAEIVIIPGHAFLGVSVTPKLTGTGTAQFEYWDVVDASSKVAADSANVRGDQLYRQNEQQKTIVGTILISDANSAGFGPMINSLP